MTRTAEDFLSAQSPRTDLNGESASPPPNTEKRSKFFISQDVFSLRRWLTFV